MAPCNGTTSTPSKFVTLPPTIAHYNGTRQWHHVHSLKVGPSPSSPTIAHYNGTLQWHPAWHHVHSPKIGRHPTPTIVHNGTRQWHHVHSPEVGQSGSSLCPPIGRKNPYSYRYLGNNSSARSRRPWRNRCVFSCKMRLAFILTVNLNTTDNSRAPLLVFFNEKCVLHQPPQIPSAFSGQMRLAFTVTVDSYETRPTAPGFRIFFQLKRASRKPFQIPCVFSSKNTSCVQCDCKFIGLAAGRSHIPCFFKESARRRNPATFLGFTFVVFSQVQCVLGSQVSVNSHVMLPAPAGCRFFFQGKTRLAGIAGMFQSWNKGI